MRKVYFLLMLFVITAAAFGEVSDSAWESLMDRDVIITKADGSTVEGTLIGVNEAEITVMKEDGEIITVQKAEAEDVRGKVSKQNETQESTASEKTELKPGYFLVNPLGFLQLGPILETGFRMAPNTYLGFHIRFTGLGLLSYLIDSSILAYSMAPGIITTYNFPVGNKDNRLYFGTAIELGLYWQEWVGRSTGAAYEGETVVFILTPNFGYKWRFDSGFFLNLGLFAGIGVITSNTYWYTSSPSDVRESSSNPPGTVYFAGGLELSLGLEFGKNGK